MDSLGGVGSTRAGAGVGGIGGSGSDGGSGADVRYEYTDLGPVNYDNNNLSVGGGRARSRSIRRQMRKNKGMARAVVDGAWDWLNETGEVMGLWRGERTRRW